MCKVDLAHRRELGLAGVEVEERNAVGVEVVGLGLGSGTEKVVQEVSTEGRFARRLWATDERPQPPTTLRKRLDGGAPLFFKMQWAQVSLERIVR